LEALLEVLAERDLKGLYRRARAGDIPNLSGVKDAYEPPLNPEVTCFSDGRETPEESAAKVIAKLEEIGYLAAR
jgi:adenylylsulfate kinase-like enzyme